MSSDSGRASLLRELSLHIVAHSENKFSLESLDPHAEMCDRGYLDSLGYVSFLAFVEDIYGVRILDHQLTGSLRTLSAVADHVLRESPRMTPP